MSIESRNKNPTGSTMIRNENGTVQQFSVEDHLIMDDLNFENINDILYDEEIHNIQNMCLSFRGEWEYKRQTQAYRKRKAYSSKNKWYQRLFKRNRIVAASSSWERDLTRECIESNPGPLSASLRLYLQRFIASQDPVVAQWEQLGSQYMPVTNLIESIMLCSYQIVKAKDHNEVRVACLSFIKHIDPKHSLAFGQCAKLLISFAQNLFRFALQSKEEFTIKDLLEHYESVRDSALVKKLYSFSMYALSLSLFDKLGVSMDSLQYSRIEQEALRRQYRLGPSFIHCLLDTCVFLIEHGQQFLRTGDFSTILHGSSAYGDWFDLTFKLTNQYQFLSNPEPHGFTQYEFQSELEDAIEKGDGIVKHAKSMGNKLMHEKTRGIVNNLKLMKSNMISRKSAAQNREAPFAILVSGGSSVAKSTFVNVLKHYFGEIMKLPQGDEYVFTRNYMDEYFVNFKSSQWCVILDDIALFNPDKAPQGDPSLCEIIQIVNSISFNPTQAALEDKGKTPMLPRLVIGTTNTPDLNAHHYFSCPLAVRRRLPFRVDIKPKKEYTKFGCMLDGSLVPEVEEGDFPDYWEIEVYQVEPDPLHKGTHKQTAVDKLIYKTESIYQFLKWYGGKAKLYEEIQKKETSCKKGFKSIKICDGCLIPVNHCECADVELQTLSEEGNERIQNILTVRAQMRHDSNLDRVERLDRPLNWYELFILLIVKCYFTSHFFSSMMKMCFGYGFIYRFILKSFNARMFKEVYRICGARAVDQIKMSSKFIFLKHASIAIVAAICASQLVAAFRNTKSTKSQGLNFTGFGSKPKPQEDERENVWYKDDYQLSTFDVSEASSSQKGIPMEQFLKRIEKNSVYAKIRVNYRFSWKATESSGFCLGGHNYVFNNHLFPDLNGEVTVSLCFSGTSGVSENITISLKESDLHRVPNRDIVLVQLKQLPPRKDITKYFPKQTLLGSHKCYYNMRRADGTHNVVLVENVQKKLLDVTGEFQSRLDLWVGKPAQTTTYGDCGSLLVSESELGPIILGFHAMLDTPKGLSMAIPLYDTDMEVVHKIFGKGVSSGTPMLDLKDKKSHLVQLHAKSVFRYIESGSAMVYGSFSDHRPKHKSRVQLTHIAKNLMDRGWLLKHGPPIMSGWEPWRIAALEMLKPVVGIDSSLMKRCADDFIEDILTALDPAELEFVHVLSDEHTINGAPGIAYLDKINRQTSAGFPWNKSKKFLMFPSVEETDIPDAVEITEEVKERVIDCISKYERRERYMPVFTAHLKDEATSFKKIKAKKTRVFTGAPLDYTIVVRKYLLSVIRLMQNNRFIFECGPGTIAQSLEWQQIKKFITKFGEDRMIAGDYKAFDKSMPPMVILEAFRIIRAICEKAGYSEKELNVIDSIAEDTAYPLINFNGDLVQFYGSNPSGHPLTVIINGLVNSLYLRYVYASLSPDKNAKQFQKHVAVMTYGDDNVMGVSKDISFFTHTSIQKCLADVGITYTMADKEAKSVPFLPLSKVSFLKRTWRWDSDIGAVVAPLEEDSIEKMVLIGVRSKTIPPEAQAVASMASAIREYFWYGKDKFEEKKAIFQQIIDEAGLHAYVEDYVLPEWEELRKSFWESSKHVSL